LTAAEVPHRAAVELGWQQVLKQRCSKIAEVLKQRRHGVHGVLGCCSKIAEAEAGAVCLACVLLLPHYHQLGGCQVTWSWGLQQGLQ
jgi:hypothetical protein